jgi:hypothetical protein
VTRLKSNKMAKTFAQQAKTITNKYKLRLGDKFDKGDALALAAMNAELTDLQTQQEAAREVELPTSVFENGGKLPNITDDEFDTISKSFDLENMSVKDIEKNLKKLNTSVTPLGGKLQESNPIDVKQRAVFEYYLNRKPNLKGSPVDVDGISGATVPVEQPQFANGGKLPMFGGGVDLNTVGSTQTFDPTAGGGEGLFTNSSTTADVAGIGGDATDPFKSRVPWMGAVGQGIGNFLANRKIDLPTYDYEEFNPTKARANLVDYSRGREQTMRERDQAQAMITRNARGTGSQAGLMENILAGATGTQREAGTAFNRSLETEGNINAQIKNRVSEFNASQDIQASQINARNKMFGSQIDRENVLINEQRRGNQIGAITNSLEGYLGDRQKATNFDQMLNMEMGRNPNFNIKQRDPTFWRKLAGITDPVEALSFQNTNDYSADKR